MANLATTADIQRCGPIHPAIDYALSAFAPCLALKAAAVIRAGLASRVAGRQSGAWQASRLTGDGFPLEFAFSTSDDRLRITLEAGAAGLDPHARLDATNILLKLAGAPAVPAEVLDDLKAMQSEGALKYGAWIGCRIGEEGTAFKLYAEVPAGVDTKSFGLPSPILPGQPVMPCMIGYTPGPHVFESYLRVPSFEPGSLAAALAPAGLDARVPWLLDFIQQSYGHALRGRLPGPSVGVSYAQGPAQLRVTLYFYARSLWGSDARIRRGFCRAAGPSGWNLQAYLDVTRPIAERESWQCFNGLFGIALDGSAPASLSIGVRPVAP